MCELAQRLPRLLPWAGEGGLRSPRTPLTMPGGESQAKHHEIALYDNRRKTKALETAGLAVLFSQEFSWISAHPASGIRGQRKSSWVLKGNRNLASCWFEQEGRFIIGKRKVGGQPGVSCGQKMPLS